MTVEICKLATSYIPMVGIQNKGSWSIKIFLSPEQLSPEPSVLLGHLQDLELVIKPVDIISLPVKGKGGHSS